MDKKQILYIILFSIVCFILGYAIYWFFFKPAIAPTPTPPPTGVEPAPTPGFPTPPEGTGVRPGVTPPEQLPPSAGRPGILPPEEQEVDEDIIVTQSVETSVKSANVDKTGNVNFYNDDDGKFYKLDKSGKITELSDEVFYNVDNVTWSPSRNETIIEYPDGSNIYYDFDTKKKATLPKHWENFTFSSQGDKIAAKSIGLAPENRWLVSSDPSGTNVELIEPLGENADKVIVDWSPNNQVVALSRTGQPMGSDRQEVLFVGRYGENFKSTIVEGRGLETEWSPTGSKLLYSVHSLRSEFKPELWIVNSEGDNIGSNRKYLSIETWADKCTFQNDRYVFCGVPTQIKVGAGYIPDVNDGIPDKLYRIDTQTGLKTEIPLEDNHTIDSIYLDENGSELYFTDKTQNGIFNVSI